MAGIAGIDDHQKLVFLQFPALYVPGVERGDEGILAAAIAAQGAERSGKVIVPRRPTSAARSASAPGAQAVRHSVPINVRRSRRAWPLKPCSSERNMISARR